MKQTVSYGALLRQAIVLSLFTTPVLAAPLLSCNHTPHAHDVVTKATAVCGSQAPDFSLLDEQNIRRSLHDEAFRGKKIVLYFYSKDTSPDSIKTATELRDHYKELEENDIIVLGIGIGTPQQHQAFKQEYSLPFSLLSDPDNTVASTYDAVKGWWLLKSPQRKTFLIDEQRKIIAIVENATIAS